jgi:hypothetical protein
MPDYHAKCDATGQQKKQVKDKLYTRTTLSWKLSCDEAGKTRKNVINAIETLPVSTGLLSMMWVTTLLSFLFEVAVIAVGWKLYRLQPKLTHLLMKQWAILTGLLLLPVLILQFVYIGGFAGSSSMYANIMATKEVLDTINDCTDKYTVVDSNFILEPVLGAYNGLSGAFGYQCFILVLVLCQIAVSGLHFAGKILKI